MSKNKFLEYPEIKSLIIRPKNLIVMLHGIGSNGNDLIGLVPHIQELMPACYFISPHGLEEYDMAPFGRQWFSLKDRTPATLSRLLDENVPLLEGLIEDKLYQLALTKKDTILIGFSQGTMMGLSLTLRSEEPYAAMVAFSGKLMPPKNLLNTQTPICFVHGKEDDVLECKEVEMATDYCTKNNIRHEKLIIENLRHSIDSNGMDFAIRFLKENTNI